MAKTCKHENCFNPCFSNGFCKWHYSRKAKKQQNSAIFPISDKRKKEGHKYTLLRKEFLLEHPTCEANLNGCLKQSSEIHHKQGRENELLTDISKFLAICRPCHEFLTKNSNLAIELGLSIHRNRNTR